MSLSFSDSFKSQRLNINHVESRHEFKESASTFINESRSKSSDDDDEWSDNSENESSEEKFSLNCLQRSSTSIHQHPSEIQVESCSNRKVGLRIEKPVLKLNSFCLVKIVNIVNLNNFYVQRIEDNHCKLEVEMKTFYEVKCKKIKRVSKPITGLFCALKYKDCWHRCQISQIVGNQCRVFLLDLGQTLIVNLNDLIVLKPSFYLTNRAIKCRLIMKAPQIDLENLVNEFKKITMDTPFPVKIQFCFTNKKKPVGVKVFVFPDKKTVIDVKAVIFKNHAINQKADNIDLRSNNEGSKCKQQSEPHSDSSCEKTRCEVVVLKIFSPAEFYVNLKHHKNCKFQTLIIVFIVSCF